MTWSQFEMDKSLDPSTDVIKYHFDKGFFLGKFKVLSPLYFFPCENKCECRKIWKSSLIFLLRDCVLKVFFESKFSLSFNVAFRAGNMGFTLSGGIF